MAAVQESAGKFKIEIDGTEVPKDVDNLLTSAIVDSNLHQPDLFVLSFRDPDRTVVSKTGAKIGSKVRVTAFSDCSPVWRPPAHGGHHGTGSRTRWRRHLHSVARLR